MWQWLVSLNADILSGLIKGSSLIVFIIISQTMISVLKLRLRWRFSYDTADLTSADEVRAVSIAYFRNRQKLDVIRAVLLLASLFIAVLFYNIEAFSFLALALSAVVINQKENLNSIVAYFFIISNYDVGDDIKMSDAQGEIVRIGMLRVVLAGRDASGEHTGKRISVPNYLFLANTSEQRELHSSAYEKVDMSIVFDPERFGMRFEMFLTKLREYLDAELPRRKLRQVGSYRGFAGEQYKLTIDYTDLGAIAIRLSFITRGADALTLKEHIVTFVESLKLPDQAKPGK